jgi:DnaJ family protein A protein 5
VDDYNPNDAPNRRIKRIIEDENKKLRAKERRAFNDSMRELVTHLKNMDKRKIEFDR